MNARIEQVVMQFKHDVGPAFQPGQSSHCAARSDTSGERGTSTPWRTHDLFQARLMHGGLAADDILLADRGFGSCGHLVMLQQAGIHAVFRAHQKQIGDFRKGRAHDAGRDRHSRGLPKSRWIRWLGRGDQIVEYHKPRERPRWMTEEEWDGLPATLLVRELRYDVLAPGSRTRSITLVTRPAERERVSGCRPGDAVCEAMRS